MVFLIFVIAVVNLNGQGNIKLKEIENREGIKVEVLTKNLVKIKYFNGRTLYKDITGYKSTILNWTNYSANYDSTIIDLRTIDTSTYSQKYKFWQEVPLGNDDYLLTGDINNNGLAELYGLRYDTYTSEPEGITALELNNNGKFDSVFYYDSTIRARSIYDIDHDGKVELDLERHVIINPDSFMHPIVQKQVFYRKILNNSLSTLQAFIFAPYPDENSQLDNINFGNFDGDKKTDLIFTNPSLNHLRIYEYNYNKNIFDSVYQYKFKNSVDYMQGFAIGDFDMDGNKELVLGGIHGDVQVIENTGDNKYTPTWAGKVETYNAFMLFQTNDIDKNGKKEFWVGGDAYYNGLGITRLTCFETNGNNNYQPVARVDLVGVFSFYAGNAFSIDVDKDGTEELFICIDQNVIILKFTGYPGHHSYKVFYIKQNELASQNSVYYGATMYDLDNNGHEEILISMDHVKENVGIKFFNYIYKPDFITGIKPRNKIPENFSIEQNYPNPFNPSTNIKFTIPSEADVSIKVYNILGEEIKTLLEKKLFPGSYNITWDVGDRAIPSGTYFIKMFSKNYYKTIKAILLK